MNYLYSIFLVAVVYITDIFSGASPSVISSIYLMPHRQLSPYSVGYLTVNFLDYLSCVSPSDIPTFCLPSDGGYYVGRLMVTVIILRIVSEGPR